MGLGRLDGVSVQMPFDLYISIDRNVYKGRNMTETEVCNNAYHVTRISFWGRIPVYDGMDWLLYFPGSFLYYIIKLYYNWFCKLQILSILFYISFFAIVKVQYHKICTLFIVLCYVVLISSVLFRYIWFFFSVYLFAAVARAIFHMKHKMYL